MQNGKIQTREVFKAAVVLIGVLDGQGVILLPTTEIHKPLTKRQLPNSEVWINTNYFLSLPGGHFDPRTESAHDAAWRELSEETGGCIFTKNLLTPWENTNLAAECLALDPSVLVPINHQPVVLQINNTWDLAIDKVSYFFFCLQEPRLTAAKLSFFCRRARQQLAPQDYRCYQEVEQYLAVPKSQFLSLILNFANFKAGPEWFFADTSTTEPFTIFSSTSNNNTYSSAYQCNKGCFYALGQSYPELQKLLL